MSNPVEIMSALETDLMVKIIRNLAKGNIGSAEWQAQKLAARGVISDEIAALVKKGTAEAVEAVREEIERAGKAAARAVDRAVEGTSYADALAPNADVSLRNIYAVWDRRAAEQITRTGASLLGSAESAYNEIVNKVTAQTLAGEITGREAIAQASKKLVDAGLPALVDRANREWTTEAYTQMVVRTTRRQVTTDIQMERTQQYGIDLVEVDSHVGARPGCEQYQGKVYSVSGQSSKYPQLTSTSKGEPDGLFGINCGHNMYPYIEGTKKTYSPYPKKENDRSYENSQEQRRLERGIRRAKREEQVLRAAGDTQGADTARQKVTQGQAAMRQFIDDTGRTRRRDREQIY